MAACFQDSYIAQRCFEAAGILLQILNSIHCVVLQKFKFDSAPQFCVVQ
jgi:hypothetical protein